MFAEDCGCNLRLCPVAGRKKGEMPLLYAIVLVSFVAAIANDWLLARRLRRALELGRFACPALENFGMGGSPIGLVTNLWRLRALPAAGALPDPELLAVRVQYRIQQALLLLVVIATVAMAIVRH
ncbi:MAG: hypothetical protein ACTHOH_02400 [Lysobacteraceae bacterium]